MTKIKSIKPNKLLRLLLQNGFYIHHQRGSHITLKSETDPLRRVTLPVHNKDLKVKTLLSILNQAVLDKEFIND